MQTVTKKYIKYCRAVTLLLLLSFPFVLSARASRKPVLSFEKNVYDLGTVSKSDSLVIAVDVIYENLGRKPVKIKKVISGCECTMVSHVDDQIDRGEKGCITVRIELKDLPLEEVYRDITVISNAKNKEESILFILNIKE